MLHSETHVWILLPMDLGTPGLGTRGFDYCSLFYPLNVVLQLWLLIGLGTAIGYTWIWVLQIWGTTDFSTGDLGTPAVVSEDC